MTEDQPQKDERAAAPLDPQNPQTAELDTSKLISPQENVSAESTPIGDSVAKELQTNQELPFTADSVKADVKKALERETQDGKGDDEVPPSDWQGYATNDVEVQD